MTDKRLYNHKVSSLFSKQNVYKKGEEVGIEVECEGRGLPVEMLSHWKCTRDGSLRNGGIEYVLRKPYPRDKVETALKYLDRKIKETGARLDMSNRTSVHVHVNCMDLSMKQTISYICMYLLFEELLMQYCGKDRHGNLFCLDAQSADYLVGYMREAIQQDTYSILGTDELRYASINVTALQKFGSLEFRALRGTADVKTIKTWVDILLRLKDKAIAYPSPVDIAYDFSSEGPARYLIKILGDLVKEIDTSDMQPREVESVLYRGARTMQDIAYAREWQTGAPKKVTKKKIVEGGVSSFAAFQARVGLRDQPMYRVLDDELNLDILDDPPDLDIGD